MKKISLLFIFCSFFAKAQSDPDVYAKTSLIKIGDTFPKFLYTDANGVAKESSEFKGKVVLINFFATWCGPCISEMPLLEEQVWNKYKDNTGFKLISFGRDHDLAEVNDFARKKSLSFAVCPDKGKLIYNQFATQYIPRNYLIDKKGKVVYVSVGFSDEEFEKLVKKIKELL